MTRRCKVTGERAAAFLDRDGVINCDHGYVSEWSDFEFLPKAVDGLRLLQSISFQLVIVTNQSGIGRGYFDDAAYRQLTRTLTQFLDDQRVSISGVYHCPHHPEAALAPYRKVCSCRKPAPGLLLRAASELNLDLSRSIMVGDKASDTEAGRAAGVARLYRLGVCEHSDADVIEMSSLYEVAIREVDLAQKV